MTWTKKTIPTTAFQFAAPIAIEAQASEDAPLDVDILANSGEVFNHGPFGPIVVDMESGTVPDKPLSILREHDSLRIAGRTSKVDKQASLRVSGTLSKVTADGLELAALLKEGQPLEASVYVPAQTIEEVPPGKSATVNGRLVAGPVSILRDWILREVSICALGADPNTKATAFTYAHGSEQTVQIQRLADETEETNEETTKETGMDEKKPETPAPATLTEAEVEKARLAAIDSERKRAVAILLKGEALGQRDMVLSLISEGVPEAQATDRLFDARFKSCTTETTAIPNAEAEPIKPTGTPTQFASVAEEVEYRWANDPEIKRTFEAKEHFAAWLRHEKVLDLHPNSKRNQGK